MGTLAEITPTSSTGSTAMNDTIHATSKTPTTTSNTATNPSTPTSAPPSFVLEVIVKYAFTQEYINQTTGECNSLACTVVTVVSF